MKKIETSTPYGSGVVNNYASIIDSVTLEQAKMTARHPLVYDPVALMPDAHLGIGATVGSVVVTRGGLIPAAVGVDIGCGVIGTRTTLKQTDVDLNAASYFLRENLPAGVGRARAEVSEYWDAFVSSNPLPSLVRENHKMMAVAANQFGTLGSGNHFAEYATDHEGYVWALVHSGSRGVGNQIAAHHIKVAEDLCVRERRPLEDKALAFFTFTDPEFGTYWSDMEWAAAYAFHQRGAMMAIMLHAIGADDSIVSTINCHHNYSVYTGPLGESVLTRKGAIDASVGRLGIIPGSMGADTYVVRGLGDPDSYSSSPHGAGRLLARGAAKRTLSVDEFKAQMTERGVMWQDRNADGLLDEAPNAYKPIDRVMQDASTLVTPVTRLRQFLNFKGV